MEPPRIYFVRIAGEVRGPLALEHLRDLGEAGLLTPESQIAASATGPWEPLGSLPLGAEVFPERRALNFKSSQFENLNHDTLPKIEIDEITKAANRPPASFRGRDVEVAPHLHLTRADEPPNEVQIIVQEVGRKVAEHAPPVVLPPAPPPFPRWKWFAVPSVLGSAGILCIPLFYDGYDEMSVSIVIGWTVLFNALLTGVMVLDRQHNRSTVSTKTQFDKLR